MFAATDLDLSSHRPAGRMKYDEGAGLVLFANHEQIEAFSLNSSTQQALWVSSIYKA